MLEQIFVDLKESWAPAMEVEFEYQHSEVNPQFANIVSPTEVVVVSSFHVELEGGGGDIHITMPYSMLEPIRELLDAGVQSDRIEHDERWLLALKDGTMDADIEMHFPLTQAELSVEEMLELKVGDVISIEMPDKIISYIDDIPIFRGLYGISKGNIGIKVLEVIKRPEQKLMPTVQESSNG
jgi:flagellar motor switch protein FliM